MSTNVGACAVAVGVAAFLGHFATAQDSCGESWVVADRDSPGSVAIAYDEHRRETLTQSGGTLWAWDGAAWTARWTEPLLDGVDAMAYDRNRRVTWIFGGAGYDDRLWKWDGSELTLVANDTIGGRAYVAMAFDWKRDRLVVHGGQSAAQWLYSSWGEFDPSTGQWTTWGNGPVGRLYAHKMVYDPIRERCVMHGGFYFFTRPETWTWDGSNFSSCCSIRGKNKRAGTGELGIGNKCHNTRTCRRTSTRSKRFKWRNRSPVKRSRRPSEEKYRRQG